MAKKEKCECPKPGLTAPFYLLTYGDMMTLLLCFFILLFAMSTIETIKFQAQVSIMQGAMGISKQYEHAPMQQNLPSPAVKQSVKIISMAKVPPSNSHSQDKEISLDADSPTNQNIEGVLRTLKSLGMDVQAHILQHDDEIILTLPTYGIFDRGEYMINPEKSEVIRSKKMYLLVAEQINYLSDYDVFFVGHTDSLAFSPRSDGQGPQNNMELGFTRAIAVYNYFFEQSLKDRTRITFASQGDNVPIIPNATLDSERRKNRRVQVHLKKKKF
jgi:chemotaxis protein MotB